MLHLIVEIHLCDVFAFMVTTTLSHGGERSPTTWMPLLLTRMRRWQLVCASVGGLIKTMRLPTVGQLVTVKNPDTSYQGGPFSSFEALYPLVPTCPICIPTTLPLGRLAHLSSSEHNSGSCSYCSLPCHSQISPELLCFPVVLSICAALPSTHDYMLALHHYRIPY
jgi:hypothetical protein